MIATTKINLDLISPMNRSTKISFCVTVCNRLWQLEKTLASNLSHVGQDFDIVLVDYGSADGVSQWVWANFEKDIKAGRLTFFEVKNKTKWHASKAKNLAHRLSRGEYLVNLDADNFIGPLDIQFILKSSSKGFISHQYTTDTTDGSYGRIGLPREVFFKLGGYDESMLPMGGQDVDLLRRLNAAAYRIVQLPPPEKKAIQNTVQDKVTEFKASNMDGLSIYESMNKINFHRSKLRLQTEGPAITGGFSSYLGLLNGKEVLINGFDSIQPLT